MNRYEVRVWPSTHDVIIEAANARHAAELVAKQQPEPGAFEVFVIGYCLHLEKYDSWEFRVVTREEVLLTSLDFIGGCPHL